MSNGTKALKKPKSFSPDVRKALRLVLDDLDNGTEDCSLEFTEIVRGVCPELRGKTMVTREKRYFRLKAGVRRLPEKLRPFYGNYPGFEEQQWESPDDMILVGRMKARWPEHHRLRRFIEELLSSKSVGRGRVV
jgi:hypothetical protein